MIRLLKKGLFVSVEMPGVSSSEFKDKVRKILRKKLTIKNPDYPFIQKNYYYNKNLLAKISQEYKQTQSPTLKEQIAKINEKLINLRRYLDNSSPEICFYKTNSQDEDYFGIGFLKMIKRILERKGYEFVIIDYEKNNYPKKVEINENDFNRKYQYEAVLKFLRKKFGIIKLPTGSGKTVIALKTIQALLPYIPENKKILFIVEQKDLVLQTKNEFIDKDANLKDKITIIGNGTLDDTGKIVIATIQSISSFKRRNFRKFDEFRKTIYFYIVDECDMFTSDKRLNLLRKFDRALYRMFLSATPTSRFKEVRRWKLKELAGNIIYTVTEQELIEQKYLAKQEAIFIKNYNIHNKNVKNIFWKNRWQFVYDNMIVKSKYRNELAKKIAFISRTYKLKTLFVTERKDHALMLSELLNVPVYTGDNDTIDRMQAIKKLESGEETIIITTRIFRRAINIPNLELFVNMAGYKNDSMITQSKGRIGRITENKDKSIYIDFLDFGNEYLENHSIERMRTLEKIGIKPKTMYITELENFIVNYFGLLAEKKVS